MKAVLQDSANACRSVAFGLAGTSASLWKTSPEAACVVLQGAVLSGVMPARSNSAADVMIFMVEPGALAALIAMSPSGPS